jgi:hypothetical protein
VGGSPEVGHVRRDWGRKSVQEVSKQNLAAWNLTLDLAGAGSRIRTDDLLIQTPGEVRSLS